MKPFRLWRLAFPWLIALAFGVVDTPIAQAQDFSLRVEHGLVTLHAKNVAVSDILAQWARLTHVTVVNGERTTGRVTLDLVNEPERSALALVLRDVSGYILADRPLATGGTTIDRILIAHGSSRAVNQGAVANQSASSPATPAPGFVLAPASDPRVAEDDREGDAVSPASARQPQPAASAATVSMPVVPSPPVMPVSLPSMVGRATSVVVGAPQPEPVEMPKAGVGGNDPAVVILPANFGQGRYPPVRQGPAPAAASKPSRPTPVPSSDVGGAAGAVAPVQHDTLPGAPGQR